MLKAAKFPISKEYIAELLECSIATVYRTISDLRDGYGAPIETNHETTNPNSIGKVI
jgi:biotin operon repressor